MKRKPTNGGTPVSKWFKSGTIYLLLLAAFLIILFRASTSVSARTQRTDLSTLANDVKAGKITAIQVSQDGVNLRITRNDQSGEFSSNKEPTSGITEVLTSLGVTPEQLDKVKVIRCDEVQWRFLGLSLAGYNVLISLALAGHAAWGAGRALRRAA